MSSQRGVTHQLEQTSSVESSDPIRSTAGGLSVVVPVYNERDNVEPLAVEIIEVLSSAELESYRPFEILFVDDGSTDGSRSKLEELATEHDIVQSIVLKRNFGQSAALEAGIDHARGDTIVTMDADLQNDPRDIPRLLDTYETGYDCVSGWRSNRQDPASKRIPSTIQTYLAKLTGPDINDFGCTLKVYSSRAIKDIDLYGEEHRYIPAKLHGKGYRITEVEVNHRERQHGTSKYGYGRLLRGSLDLLFHFFWNRFRARPFHLFGTLGAIFFSIGTLVGSHAVVMRYLLGQELGTNIPRLLLVVSFVLFGVQLLIFGVLSEMLTRMYYRDQRPYRVETVIE